MTVKISAEQGQKIAIENQEALRARREDLKKRQAAARQYREENKVRILHLPTLVGEKYDVPQVATKGGMTLAYILSPYGGQVTVATAVCHSSEGYDRKKGSMHAVENLMANRAVTLPVAKYMQEQIRAVISDVKKQVKLSKQLRDRALEQGEAGTFPPIPEVTANDIARITQGAIDSYLRNMFSMAVTDVSLLEHDVVLPCCAGR